MRYGFYCLLLAFFSSTNFAANPNPAKRKVEEIGTFAQRTYTVADYINDNDRTHEWGKDRFAQLLKIAEGIVETGFRKRIVYKDLSVNTIAMRNSRWGADEDLDSDFESDDDVLAKSKR